MPDYQKMYSTLFNGITDTIEQLQRMQVKAEELYIDSEKAPLHMIKEIKTDKESGERLPVNVSTDVHHHSNES